MDATREKGRVLSLPEVTATGDRRASLEALRQALAVAISNDPLARDLAALSRQLSQVIREIDGLPDAKVRSPLDDLTAKRAARVAAS